MSSPIMHPKPSHRSITAATLLLSLAITLSNAPAASAAGAFGSLVGTWSGKGVMHLEDGQQEAIACEASYKEKDKGKGKKKGTKITMTLKCDSNRFKVNLRSRLSHKDGTLSGGWMELDREVSGSGKGQIDDQSISLYLNAVGFSADLKVARGDCNQSVELIPESGEVKRVTVEMKKSGC